MQKLGTVAGDNLTGLDVIEIQERHLKLLSIGMGAPMILDFCL
jgi:hypothetical protein